jgi:hypothetical protein
MKKLLLTSVLALASFAFVSAPMLRAQDSITIKDPAEFNAYQLFTTQTDLNAKAAAGETFLTQYPQSVVKKNVLDALMDTYQGIPNMDKALSAASRMLQLDPNYMRAVVLSVYIKKTQCGKTQDAQTCDDAATLARKGLTIAKPADVTDADWKTQTDTTAPIFHSAIAFDDAVSKKDFKGAVEEYRTELMLLPIEQTKVVPGLMDTLLLAEAYTKPDAKDIPLAVWFYCRAWNFAPAGFKGQIEPKIEYWYKRFHGNLDGLNDIKAQAALTVFPAGGTPTIKAAPTPAERIHDLLASTSDWNTLALADKELVLALGSKEDADKLWALLQGKQSPVPGVVIEATASVIKVAVTQDAKDAKVADFIVNMKEPLADKDIPAAGFEFKLQPGTELDGTYDTYTQVPATATTTQSAQIVLKDAFIQAEKKKAAPAHKPAAGHKPAAH